MQDDDELIATALQLVARDDEDDDEDEGADSG